MYDFHYTFIKKHFDAEFVFTNTDSLTYVIKAKDVMKNFLSTNNCLTWVTIWKIQSFLTRLITKLLVKWKTSLKEK